MDRPDLREYHVYNGVMKHIRKEDGSLDIDLLCKKWNATWSLQRYREEWRVIKFARVKSAEKHVSLGVTKEQANYLITTLSLHEMRVMATSSAWRNEEYFKKVLGDNYKDLI